MNFKSIAIAASLVLAAGASFAEDIDLSGSATASISVATLLSVAEANLVPGVAPSLNTAVIFQDATGDANQIAQIDQIGTATSFAMIVQQAATPSLAYIQQNATTASVAVINQR